MKHVLPELKYNYNALEPYIDELTMSIHHSKHHAAYVNNLNAALQNYPELQELSLEKLLTALDSVPESIRTVVKNNGGGHYNHSFFWSILSSNSSTAPSDKLEKAILQSFGSFESFKEEFTKAATTRFGSGWAWLVLDKDNLLKVMSTPNQDNPIVDGLIPILGLDVWEHAYYLNYQNKRPDYISAWWNIIDWDEVSKLYSKHTDK